MLLRHSLSLLVLVSPFGCQASPRVEPASATEQQPAAPVPPTEAVAEPPLPRHPSEGEVLVETAPDWRGTQIYRGDAGVWYLHVAKVVSVYGHNEVIATDDKGRVLVLTVYSGKWSEVWTNPDEQWVAPARPADVDPRIPGEELYAAGKAGNVHQLTFTELPFGKFALQSREIGHAASEEFHAVLAHDVDPVRPGSELLCFGITGAVYVVTPAADGDAFAMTKLAELPGRVRDTLVVEDPRDGKPLVLAASRSGDLLALRMRGGKLESEVLAHETSGLGRLARKPAKSGAAKDRELPVVYATRDDGVLLRFELGKDGRAQKELIFAGEQGLRGVAAGRFFDDGREAVAVYGYGRSVHLITRAKVGGWQVETIWKSLQQGHWLAVGELDGRNTTDELVCSGFDGDVVMLARPIGYGLPQAAVPGRAAMPVEAPKTVDAPRTVDAPKTVEAPKAPASDGSSGSQKKD